MVQQASVVTPARFSEGLTYAEYFAAIDRNQARFQENYDGTQVSAQDAVRLKALAAKPKGPARMLVLGEAWCPDVFRGAPVLARIAEAAGIEARFFFRDQNNDIMAEFLNGGQFESIPVAVFYTKDFDQIGSWIERPALANKQMREDLASMYARFRKPDQTPEEREQTKTDYIAFQNGPVWGGWRQETIREIIALLEEKAG